MSKQVIVSLVDQYLARGGTITLCKAATAYGGESKQRRH